MGVVWEASSLSDAEVVEHEEWGEVTEGHRSDGPSDDSPNALLSFNGENALYDGSGESGHGLRW